MRPLYEEVVRGYRFALPDLEAVVLCIDDLPPHARAAWRAAYRRGTQDLGAHHAVLRRCVEVWDGRVAILPDGTEWGLDYIAPYRRDQK